MQMILVATYAYILDFHVNLCRSLSVCISNPCIVSKKGLLGSSLNLNRITLREMLRSLSSGYNFLRPLLGFIGNTLKFTGNISAACVRMTRICMQSTKVCDSGLCSSACSGACSGALIGLSLPSTQVEYSDEEDQLS